MTPTTSNATNITNNSLLNQVAINYQKTHQTTQNIVACNHTITKIYERPLQYLLDDCTICRETFFNPQKKIAMYECTHIFHEYCAKQYLNTNLY